MIDDAALAFGANALTGRATPAAGDWRERLAGLAPDVRARLGRQAEMLTAIGRGLAPYPYEERRAVLSHMTPALVASGIPAGEIGAFDPTDANLRAATASAAALGRLISAGAGAGAGAGPAPPAEPPP